MSPMLPEWVQWVQAIAQALAVPVIAGVGVWIAFVQSRIARAKLQHDLFDRRFAVYEATRTLLLVIMRKGNASLDDLSRFTMGTIDAVFLLDKSTSTYLQDIRKRTVKLHSLSASIDPDAPA